MITIIQKQQRVLNRIFLYTAFSILFISLLACNNKKEVNETERSSELINVKENNNTVSEYVRFVESDKNKMELDHAYTNEALKKLVQATNAMANEVDYDVKADMDKVKQYADKITDDPSATTHADNIRKAADIVTSALVKMQKSKFPELSKEAQDLQRASASIKPEVLTLEQKNAVKSYFEKSADLLEKMN